MSETNATKENTHTIIINKGTGAGGANTNKNGLSYEELTDLSTNYVEVGIVNNGKNKYKSIKFESSVNEYISVNKSKFHSYMDFIHEKNTTIKLAGGCKAPDEAYVDIIRKNLFIIEKKFQQGPGSVDEKIQSGGFTPFYISNADFI